MSKQIAVRLPEEIAAFVDEQVASGRAASRAAVVVRALERDRRREAAERDARIYAESAEPDDLGGLAEWAAAQHPDIY